MLIDSICEVFQASFSLRQTMIAFVVAFEIFIRPLCLSRDPIVVVDCELLLGARRSAASSSHRSHDRSSV